MYHYVFSVLEIENTIDSSCETFELQKRVNFVMKTVELINIHKKKKKNSMQRTNDIWLEFLKLQEPTICRNVVSMSMDQIGGVIILANPVRHIRNPVT